MELLRHSINHDGYTQPVVTWSDDNSREVIDGFHRTRVCKECDDVRKRVHGYLPVVTIREDCKERNDRIASWHDRGYDLIPDEAPKILEAKCWAPSWRRLCRCILRNDYWCKGLGQSQPKSDAYKRFKEIKKNMVKK